MLFGVNCGKLMDKKMVHEKWCIALIRMDRPDVHKSVFHVSLMCLVNLTRY